MPVFEIVPNFSEGRDPAFLEAAAATALESGARVLHRTATRPTTAASSRSPATATKCCEAGVALAGMAADRIDLRRHRGAHPRIGALDVLPFVPLEGAEPGRRCRSRPSSRCRDLGALPESLILLRSRGPPRQPAKSARLAPRRVRRTRRSLCRSAVGPRRGRRRSARKRRRGGHRRPARLDRFQR